MTRRFHPFLVVPFLVYGLTCSRHVGLPDSAVILGAMRNLEMGVQAWNHPLTNLLGWFALHLLPGENEFLKVNLVSTLGGGIAIGLFYLALTRMRVPRAAAALGAAAFMLSHSMWWHAVWVESYAWNVVFLLACLHLVLSCGGAESAGATGAPTRARHPVVMPALPPPDSKLITALGLRVRDHRPDEKQRLGIEEGVPAGVVITAVDPESRFQELQAGDRILLVKDPDGIITQLADAADLRDRVAHLRDRGGQIYVDVGDEAHWLPFLPAN